MIHLLSGFLQSCRRSAGSYSNVGLGSADGSFEKDKIKRNANEANTRDFTYFMLGNARFVYASAARLILIKVIAYISIYIFCPNLFSNTYLSLSRV